MVNISLVASTISGLLSISSSIEIEIGVKIGVIKNGKLKLEIGVRPGVDE